MRKGLKVDGPLYQPGHSTYCYLRVINLSNEDIIIRKEAIAQIIFIRLNKIPNLTYDKQVNAKYNNELTYRN